MTPGVTSFISNVCGSMILLPFLHAIIVDLYPLCEAVSDFHQLHMKQNEVAVTQLAFLTAKGKSGASLSIIIIIVIVVVELFALRCNHTFLLHKYSKSALIFCHQTLTLSLMEDSMSLKLFRKWRSFFFHSCTFSWTSESCSNKKLR